MIVRTLDMLPTLRLLGNLERTERNGNVMVAGIRCLPSVPWYRCGDIQMDWFYMHTLTLKHIDSCNILIHKYSPVSLLKFPSYWGKCEKFGISHIFSFFPINFIFLFFHFFCFFFKKKKTIPGNLGRSTASLIFSLCCYGKWQIGEKMGKK